MKKQTVFNQLEMNEDGLIQIRFQKQFVDDDGSVTALGWHRTILEPGGNIDEQLSSADANLKAMGEGGLKETAGLDAVRRVVETVHTPEAIAEFQQKQQVAEQKRLA